MRNKKTKEPNRKHILRIITIVISSVLVVTILSGAVVLAANDWDFQKAYNDIVHGSDSNPYPAYIVNDYNDLKPDIAGDEASLDEMTLATKQWFEYVDYDYYEDVVDGAFIYKIYTPVDYGTSSIMAIKDYNPNEISGSSIKLDCVWRDMAVMFANIAASNATVILSGGISSGIAGLVGQEAVAVGATALLRTNTDILKLAPYYASPDFMGIPNTEWNGISNTGFYNASSITISMSASATMNVAKVNTIDSTYSVGGSSVAKAEAGGFLLPKVSGEISASASSALGYGVNYQQGQSINNDITVSRTFSSRTDDEVKDAGWKLVEYVVRIPYKVVVVSAENPDNVISTAFVTNDLLHGVCRVFTNGYIEHWNTGKLVTYADFFEGFLTESELVQKAKIAMGGN